jgi:tetratricopeptide (TPR) repeat protein
VEDKERQRKYLKGILSEERATLSVGNRVLGAMIAGGYCRAAFTTNFDSVVEKAVAEVAGQSLSAYHLEGSHAANQALNNEEFPIYCKLHGDFRYDSLKNLPADLATQNAALAECLLNAGNRFGFIVTGYSGRDQSIMDLFRAVLNTNNPFPHGLFWTGIKGSAPRPAVDELLQQARAKGIAYQYLNRRQDAEAAYKKAIQLRPNDWRGYQSLGNYYFNNFREAEAVQYYRRVLSLTPGNYNAYNDLGAAYFRMGNYSEAAAQIEKSVALKPLAMNYGNLGAVYALQGRFRDAARLYEKAVSAVSTNSIWWGNLADAYRWTPELSSKAPAAYRKAVLLGEDELAGNPRDSQLRSRVALYLAALGDKDSASREIAEALRLSSDDGYVLFRSALVYEQLHKRDAAGDAIRAALRAGYPAEEIRKEPILENLRTDPKYKFLFGLK